MRGIKFRFIGPKSASLPNQPFPSFVFRSLEARNLNGSIPAIVLLNENIAAFGLRPINGTLDYAGFFGKDPAFHSWAKDLFLYYW